MKKHIKFLIEGIHCASCKAIIETELKELNGIKNITVNYQNGETELEFDDTKISKKHIFANIKKLNYQVLDKSPKNIYQKFSLIFPVVALLLIIVAYAIINYFGGFELLSRLSEKNIGLSLIFIIGLLSGFHCIGMCGGFVVAYSSKQTNKFLPHLKYNLGRLISYTIIGAILGGLGSFFGINPVFTGTVTIIAAVFMILLGISYATKWKLLEGFISYTPEFISRFIYKCKHNKKINTPLSIGLLTGFMPCGPLQAIQLYALTTGSAFNGALSMGIFALGTSTIMIIFGIIVSSFSQKNIPYFLKISGVLVIFLGLMMLSRGLSNFNLSFLPLSKSSDIQVSQVPSSNFQEVRMELNSYGYEPNVLQIKPEIPVRWIINVKQMSGCTDAIMIESLGIKQDLKYGENIIEFTPPKNVSEIKFSCWMRMVWGKFIVSNQTSKYITPKVKDPIVEAGASCSGACGGSSGSSSTCTAKPGEACSCANKN